MVNIPQIQELSEKFDGTHKFCAEELLVPNVNKCDAVRINMWTNHLPQALVLKKGDFPNVFTGFEDQVGKHSVAFKVADRDWKIARKIEKNKLNSAMILIDKDKNLQIILFNPSERITERYGYRVVSPPIVKKATKGDTIKKGEVIYRSTTYDDNMHFCYGKNLKAIYLAWRGLTYEDAIVISQSAAKDLTAYSPDEFDITINKNDILLNLYGDDESYKAFPDIGEKVKGRVCASRRRLAYESIMFDLNNTNIKKVNYDTDTLFYVNKGSVVTDVDVFCNADISYLREYPYYDQIVKYLEMNKTYYTNIVTTVDRYIEKGYKLTEDAQYIYRRAQDMINPDTQFKFDGNSFDNLVIKIKTLSENPAVIGCKLTGRYGNKGCISAILPDEEMPVNEYGERVDIILNPMGVPGRENMGQLDEQELNFIADTCLRQTLDMKTSDEKIKHIEKYFKIVDPKVTLPLIVKKRKEGTEEEKVAFLEECYEKGLFVRQAPFFDNIKMEDLGKLYEIFGYEPYTFTVDGQEIEEKLIMGNLYFIRLKHDPKSKLSIRSSGDLSINNIPAKSSSFKYHNSLFSKTPVRMGEMEFVSLALMKDMDKIIKYIKQTSSNPEERKNYNNALVTTPNVFDIDNIELIGTESVTSQIIRMFFLAIGIENIDNRANEMIYETAEKYSINPNDLNEVYQNLIENYEEEGDNEDE